MGARELNACTVRNEGFRKGLAGKVGFINNVYGCYLRFRVAFAAT